MKYNYISLNRYKVLAIIFTTCIFVSGILTGIFSAREIGAKMLVSDKNNLPAAPSTIDYVKGMIKGAEDGMNSGFYAKGLLINLFGFVSNFMNKRIIEDVSINNTVYKLDNGQITFSYPEYDITKNADNTVKLNTYLLSLDIPLIYVQAPFKINKYDNQLPYGIEDTTNKMADLFLSKIQKSGVKTLDLREEIVFGNIDHSGLFFNTDHHWKPEAGLWATGLIANFLESNYGLYIDDSYFNITNYNIKIYKNWFLGSQGKRVGVGYAGVDDINLIIPKFNTNFEFSVPSKQLVKKGDFSDTMLFMENLKNINYFKLNPYAVYTGTSYPLNKIKNMNNNNGKKALLVRDSFSGVVAPFLAMCFEELDIIDLRYFTSMSLKEYIKETLPSIVIMLYNPSAFKQDSPEDDLQFIFE